MIKVLSSVSLPILLTTLFSLTNFSSLQGQSWNVEYQRSKVFIENKGQFQLRKSCNGDEQVLFAFDEGRKKIHFTKSGLSFSLTEHYKYGEHYTPEERIKKYSNFKSSEEWLEHERKEKLGKWKKDDVSFHWEGANENVEIIAEAPVEDYFSYSYRDKNGELQHVNHINGYKKITYKNLYPNIDVEYRLHQEDGIKYDIIIHPGGDPSKIKMVYSDEVLLDYEGNINIPTELGEIVEHAPKTFSRLSCRCAAWECEHYQTLGSSFFVEGKSVSFHLNSYDATKTIIIDPWVQTPPLTNPSGAWEVEVDGAGNVYTIGGGMPMQLLKYNSAGVLQWTYNTPYDTAGNWLGALATDDAGNSYVTSGSTAAITKVNTSAGVIYSVGGGALDEYWQIAFNCDQTKLLIGGTRLPLFPLGNYESAMIFDVNPNTGGVNSSVFVGRASGISPTEVRAITPSYNAKYYYLTHDSLGAFDQNLGATCPVPEPALQIEHGYNFAYKCEDFRPNNGNGPFSAIVADANFVYTQDGSTVDKRDLLTGAILTSAAIPGGITTTDFFGDNVAGNSGIDMDDCGNVYVGSSDRIIKYDGNLNILSQINLPYRVSDVEVSPSGEIVFCGSTGTSSSTNRTGYVESANMTSCNPTSLVCCDANVCPAGPFCDFDAPETLIPNTPGGTWSGPGITNASAGTFDPSVAGLGTHTITYTIACGSESIYITVSACDSIDVCEESNGDLTATGGTGGPYTWEEPAVIQDCSACLPAPFPPCTLPPGCVVTTVGWNTFATGTTVTPPAGADTIRVTDANGSEVIIYDISNLPPCSCDATIDPAGPFCDDAAAVNLTAAQTGGTWTGTGITDGVNGTFDPATAGPGSWTITYNMPCGDMDTETIVVNASDDATFSYSPTTYCLTDNDPMPTVSGTTGGTFSISPAGTINASSGLIDLSTTGTGTFTVTYTTGGVCPDAATFSITINSTADATITPAGPFCTGDPAINLTAATAGGTWSGPGITNAANGTFDPASAGVGTHTITYTISGACGDTDTEDIVVTNSSDATISSTGAFCSNEMAVTLSAVDGGGIWSGNGITDATNGTFDPGVAGPGTHTITYDIPGTCGDTDTEDIVVNAAQDATISPAGPFCTGDPAINLTATNAGGTWSGNGITDATNGTFDPGVAGPGTHTITYSIPGACGDTDTEDIVVNAAQDATVNPAGPFCTGDPAINITAINGGGTWSGNGITDATNGTFDPATAGTGNHVITYILAGPCADTGTITIAVNSAFDATIMAAGPFCSDEMAVNLTAADIGGTWSGNGITDATNGTFDPGVAGAGTHTITYDIPGSCGDTDTEDIIVNAAQDATVNPAGPFCLTDPALNLTATNAGGTWSGTGITDATNGTFDPATAGTGNHVITYILAGPCADTGSITIAVNSAFDATITPAGPFCETDPAVNLTAADPGGIWSGTGITDATNGTFDPAVAGIGMHSIFYDIVGSCGDSDTISVVVTVALDATVTPAGPFCINDAALNLTAVDPGGTWSGTGITDATNGTFDPMVAGAGSHMVIYTIGGNCGDADSTTIVVTSAFDATINPVGVLCEGDAPITLTAADPGGTWSGTGITDATNGTFSPTVAGQGIHTITYTISGACGDSQTIDITVGGITITNVEVFDISCPDSCDGSANVITSGGTLPITYAWSDGQSTQTATGLCPGTHDITVTDNDGCSFSSVGTISTPPPLSVDAGPDQTINFGDAANINATVPGGVTITWSPDADLSCNDCPNPIATPGLTTEYLLEIMDANGCEASDSVTIFVLEEPGFIVIPNAFTPNGDGRNDVFNVIGSNIDHIEMAVFNRWGEKIFESLDVNFGWDGTYKGKEQEQAVYIYYIIVGMTDGTTKTLSGNVTLVR